MLRATLALLTFFFLAGCTKQPISDFTDSTEITRIAFGSCAHQDKPQEIWDAVLAFQPQLFLFLGDNIYGDTDDAAELRRKYAQLGSKGGYQKLKEFSRILATWDDHDYGKNDGGAEFEMKQASKEAFLDFFEEPAESPRRKRQGIYASYLFGPPGRRVQILVLDTRFFRTPLTLRTSMNAFKNERKELQPGDMVPGRYAPNHDPNATILGWDQWHWLNSQLQVAADIRIIASSIQVLAEFTGWESWANFPLERRRLMKLLRRNRIKNAVFISGDTHRGEISHQNIFRIGDLYDVTSSGLTEVATVSAPNIHRIERPFIEKNFGAITIKWDAPVPQVTLEIRNNEGVVLLSRGFLIQ